MIFLQGQTAEAIMLDPRSGRRRLHYQLIRRRFHFRRMEHQIRAIQKVRIMKYLYAIVYQILN